MQQQDAHDFVLGMLLYLDEIHKILVLQWHSGHQPSMDNNAAMAWNREREGQLVHESYIFLVNFAQPLPFVLQENQSKFEADNPGPASGNYLGLR